MKNQKSLCSVHSERKSAVKLGSQFRDNRKLKITGLILGIASTIWILIRVIPKPTRATYPCVRVAAPLASGFFVYILSVLTSILAFRQAKMYFHHSRYLIAGVFLLIAFVGGLWSVTGSNHSTYAGFSFKQQEPNMPIGEARGIFPGRVVWAHDSAATNVNCEINYDDAWFMDKNSNMEVIDKMVSDAVRELTGGSSDSLAWDLLFRDFNQKKGKTGGYVSGEKIFLKMNITSAYGFFGDGNINESDYSKVENNHFNLVETSPHVTLAFLRQLINKYGISQEDIYVGDPMKHIYKHYWDLWYPEFPNVNYIDHDASLGRTQVYESTNPLIFYSDRGTVIDEESDHLYTIFEEAEYMINLGSFKAHEFAGITVCTKNHFGSHTRDSASHLHAALVRASRNGPMREEMGMYRVLTDIMGHDLLGGNTMLFVSDALWTAPHELDNPVKWNMSPFNGDYPSSIFISQDQVALESVCYDFLRTEFIWGDAWPQMGAVDDYLEQAADSTKWPEGIIYDPENDGTPMPSMGVQEHWNNAVDKQYSRNLGTGNGIELVYLNPNVTTISEKQITKVVDKFTLHQNFPNPFNPFTTIQYQLSHSSNVRLEIYNIGGERVRTLVNGYQSAKLYTVLWDGHDENDQMVASGIYFYRLSASNGTERRIVSKKMILTK